jgi:hypothetical protein
MVGRVVEEFFFTKIQFGQIDFSLKPINNLFNFSKTDSLKSRMGYPICSDEWGKIGATRNPPLHLGDRATPSTSTYQTFQRRFEPLILSDS